MIHQPDYVKLLLKKHFEQGLSKTELLLLQDAFHLYDETDLKKMIDETMVTSLPGVNPPPIDWEAFVVEEMAGLRKNTV